MEGTKSKQLKFYLNPKQYEKLIAIAKRNNISPTAMAKAVVMESIGEQIGFAPSDLYEQLRKRNEQLMVEIGRMEKDLSRLRLQEQKLENLERRMEILERKYTAR